MKPFKKSNHRGSNPATHVLYVTHFTTAPITRRGGGLSASPIVNTKKANENVRNPSGRGGVSPSPNTKANEELMKPYKKKHSSRVEPGNTRTVCDIARLTWTGRDCRPPLIQKPMENL